jgi:hypothetical protein
MTTTNRTALLSLAALFALAATPHRAAAQQNAMPAKPAALAERGEAATPPSQGGEGIRVHGHWKMVVHNRDGSLAKTYEFENSLIAPQQGDTVLTYLLAGWMAAGNFNIQVNGGGTGLCGGGPVCYIVNSVTATQTAGVLYCQTNPDPCSVTLQSTVLNNLSSGTPTNAAQLQLQGTITATGTTAITAVRTNLSTCVPPGGTGVSQVSPSMCASQTGLTGLNASLYTFGFTATTLPTPLAVVSGQTVTVTVTISFS